MLLVFSETENRTYHGDTHPTQPTPGFAGTPARRHGERRKVLPRINADEFGSGKPLTTERTEDTEGKPKQVYRGSTRMHAD